MKIKTLAAAALAAFSVFGAATASAANDRPYLQGFYAADEGSTIKIQADVCDYSAPVVATYRYTFRIYGPSGAQVAQRSFTRRHSLACVRVNQTFADVFPNGGYRAQVQINNLSNGGYIRNQARYFGIYG